MANRNTRIRGVQILYNTIDENHITASVAGDGLSGGNGSALALDLNELTVAVVDVASDSIGIIDANDGNASRKETIADLVSAMAGSGLTATNGVLDVIEHASGIITDDDIVRNEVLAKDSGSDTDFTLANTPVADTVNIYLNGLLQQPGTGEDYIISGSSIVFAEAVDDADIVIADYIIT